MSALKSTLLHTLELAVALGASFLVLKFFKVDSETTTVLLGLAVAAVAKFARAHDGIPYKDFVNE